MKFLLTLFIATASLGAHAAAPAEKVLWDTWYTVTVANKVHYGYYNDKATLREGKVTFQNHFWKLEEGFINEERLGALADDTADLTPVFFNFKSSYRATETNIDGAVNPKTHALNVRVLRGGKELPSIIKALPKGLFTSSLFPIWAARHLGQLKPGQAVPFLTLMEDGFEHGFETVNGTVRLEQPDDFARKTGTRKLTVKFQDRSSIWYLEASGCPVRIEMPGMHSVVERVSGDQAKQFLAQ